MGIIHAILAFLKAIPALADLFKWIGAKSNESAANRRLDAKNATVDAAIDAAIGRVRDQPEAGQQPKVDPEK